MSNFNTKIASILRSGKAVRSNVQEAGIMAAEHLYDCGDPAYFIKLARAVAEVYGKGKKFKSFILWVTTFSGYNKTVAKEGTKDTFTMDGKQFIFTKSKDFEGVQLDGFKHKQWDSMEPEGQTEKKEVSFKEALERLVKKYGDKELTADDAKILKAVIADLSA